MARDPPCDRPEQDEDRNFQENNSPFRVLYGSIGKTGRRTVSVSIP